ncbi:MAG TPA: hypothetical protein VEO01_21810 [Pseudonocardiaceae bacterium]|nr:hypothetical protein [Pseudonocardiaceae bacterium]
MSTEGRTSRRAVPTQLAALAAGVTEATIRKWASRGKLTRYGRPSRAEYDLDEILSLLAQKEAALT